MPWEPDWEPGPHGKGKTSPNNVLAQKIARKQVIGKYFTIDSPEVIELMTTTA